MGSSPAPSTKTLRLLVIPLLLLVGLAIGVFIWWQHYQTTPAYSLALLVDASQRNDQAALNQLFDTDQVVETFLSEQAGRIGPTGALSLPSSIPGVSLIASAGKEKIRPIVREGIVREINEISKQAANKPFIVVALAIPFKTSINQANNQAQASVDWRNEKLELQMRRDDRGFWKVISLKDDAMAARIMAEAAKGLPEKLSPEGLRKPLSDILPKDLLPSPLR